MAQIAIRTSLAESLLALESALAANPTPFLKFGPRFEHDLSNDILGTNLDRLIWQYSNQHSQAISAIRLGSPSVGFTTLRPTHIRSTLCELESDGYTIVLNEINMMSPEVESLCEDVSSAFSSYCYANLYISPPSAQGFPAHRDPQKILALQISGQKSWELGSKFEDGSKSVMNVELHPGEMLFLDEMVLHKVTTRAERSIHLTFGIQVLKVNDVLQLLRRRIDERAAAAGLSGLEVPMAFSQTRKIIQRELENLAKEMQSAGLGER